MKKDVVISVNEINPVDYYNFNHIDHAINLLKSTKNVIKTSINSFSYIENKADKNKKMIIVDDLGFHVKMKNGLGLETGKTYTPFMLMQKLKYENSFQQAITFVIYELMNNNCDYVRVGYKFYKKITKVDRNEIRRTILKVWDKYTIIDDFGKEYLELIPKFNDFTIHPDNKNYSQIIGDNYNLYSPFEHEPVDEKKYKSEIQWYWTKNLLEHIFGEQYEIGLKYVKVLYDLPRQKLPILVLVSKERSTGKTTFIDWLEMLFGANTVIINPENISNQFNSAYADKNIVMIEESRFDGNAALEKLKNLATQKKILVNEKFVSNYSIPFHGKIIITSNDEDKFSRIDDPEIRYWVRKIPTLEGKANHDILMDLKKEIPYFLHYLSTLEPVDTKKSRMVFEADELLTEALTIVKQESLPSLHKEIIILLDEHCEQNVGIKEFMFTANDLKKKFFKNNNKIEINYINKILRGSINLERSKQQRYTPLESSYNSIQAKKNGRPYIYVNKFYEKDKAETTSNNY